MRRRLRLRIVGAAAAALRLRPDGVRARLFDDDDQHDDDVVPVRLDDDDDAAALPLMILGAIAWLVFLGWVVAAVGAVLEGCRRRRQRRR